MVGRLGQSFGRGTCTATRARRTTIVRRFAMPFAQSQPSMASSLPMPAGLGDSVDRDARLSASALVASAEQLEHTGTIDAPAGGFANAGPGRRAVGSAAPAGRGVRFQEIAPPDTPAGAAMRGPTAGGATQLTFRDGFEGWRSALELVSDDGALAGADVAHDRASAIALRHGALHDGSSAYALSTSAQVAASAAAVRAAPAKRATDEAARASLRAAAASEGARKAAAMASAARNVAAAGSSPQVLSPPALDGRAKRPLLPTT